MLILKEIRAFGDEGCGDEKSDGVDDEEECHDAKGHHGDLYAPGSHDVDEISEKKKRKDGASNNDDERWESLVKEMNLVLPETCALETGLLNSWKGDGAHGEPWTTHPLEMVILSGEPSEEQSAPNAPVKLVLAGEEFLAARVAADDKHEVAIVGPKRSLLETAELENVVRRRVVSVNVGWESESTKSAEEETEGVKVSGSMDCVGMPMVLDQEYVERF